jgi:hypothetical protein
MSCGRSDQRSAKGSDQKTGWVNLPETAVARPHVSTGGNDWNLVFVEATVALPVGVES